MRLDYFALVIWYLSGESPPFFFASPHGEVCIVPGRVQEAVRGKKKILIFLVLRTKQGVSGRSCAHWKHNKVATVLQL